MCFVYSFIFVSARGIKTVCPLLKCISIAYYIRNDSRGKTGQIVGRKGRISSCRCLHIVHGELTPKNRAQKPNNIPFLTEKGELVKYVPVVTNVVWLSRTKRSVMQFEWYKVCIKYSYIM